jgi:hypothetical protein
MLACVAGAVLYAGLAGISLDALKKQVTELPQEDALLVVFYGIRVLFVLVFAIAVIIFAVLSAFCLIISLLFFSRILKN